LSFIFNHFFTGLLSGRQKVFLFFNTLAVFFIALSFYLTGGLVGFYSELLMLFINFSAFYIKEEIQKQLKKLFPFYLFYLESRVCYPKS